MFLKTKCLRQVALSCINVDNPTITICSILGIFAPWLNQWVTPSPPQEKKLYYTGSHCQLNLVIKFAPWVNVYTLTNDLKATIYPVFCRVLLCGQFGNRNHLQRLLPPLVQFSEFKKKKSVLFNMITKLCVVWWNWTKTFRAAQKTSQINSIC